MYKTLIKLGNAKPELQKHLRPILDVLTKQASDRGNLGDDFDRIEESLAQTFFPELNRNVRLEIKRGREEQGDFWYESKVTLNAPGEMSDYEILEAVQETFHDMESRMNGYFSSQWIRDIARNAKIQKRGRIKTISLQLPDLLDYSF